MLSCIPVCLMAAGGQARLSEIYVCAFSSTFCFLFCGEGWRGAMRRAAGCRLLRGLIGRLSCYTLLLEEKRRGMTGPSLHNESGKKEESNDDNGCIFPSTLGQ